MPGVKPKVNGEIIRGRGGCYAQRRILPRMVVAAILGVLFFTGQGRRGQERHRPHNHRHYARARYGAPLFQLLYAPPHRDDAAAKGGRRPGAAAGRKKKK